MRGLLLSFLLLAVASFAQQQKPLDCKEVINAVVMGNKASKALSPARGQALLKSLKRVAKYARKLNKCPDGIQEIMTEFDALLSRVATRQANFQAAQSSLNFLNRLYLKFGRYKDHNKCFEYMEGIKVHPKLYQKTLSTSDSARAQFYKDAAVIKEWVKTLENNKGCVVPPPPKPKNKDMAKLKKAMAKTKDLMAKLTQKIKEQKKKRLAKLKAKKNGKKVNKIGKSGKNGKNGKPLPAAGAKKLKNKKLGKGKNKKKLTKKQKAKLAKKKRIIKKRATYVDKVVKRLRDFSAANEMAAEAVGKFSSLVRAHIFPPAPVKASTSSSKF